MAGRSPARCVDELDFAVLCPNWDVIALRDQLRRRAEIFARFMVEVDKYFRDELSHVEYAKRWKAEQSVGRRKRAKWRRGGVVAGSSRVVQKHHSAFGLVGWSLSC